jgi:hypothetical protein
MIKSSVLGSLKRTTGLDRAIFYTVCARGWTAAMTLIIIAAIARYLSPAEQGYYYSFSSLVAVQALFELGLSFVILQMASHERAHLDIRSDGQIAGDAIAHERLASLLQNCVRWYAIAAYIMAGVLIPFGYVFFSHRTTSGTIILWQHPWVCVVIAATFTFQIDPIFSFLEGCGYVSQVARTRLVQSVLGGGLALASLVTHHGLFAPALLIAGKAIGGCSLLFVNRHLLISLLRHRIGSYAVQWRTDIWPFQWRIAVAWISGYFTFEVFSPILFAFRGPTEAGKMGMSLTICAGLTAFSYAWLSTKAAPFGTMAAQKRFDDLDQVFFRALPQAIAIALFGSAAIVLGELYAIRRHFHVASRLEPPWIMALLLAATVANTIWFSQALYIRAHKQERFMFLQLGSALCLAASSLLLVRRFGSAGMAISYFVVSLVIGVGGGTIVFHRFRNTRHTLSAEAKAFDPFNPALGNHAVNEPNGTSSSKG